MGVGTEDTVTESKTQLKTIWSSALPSPTALEEARKFVHFKVAGTESAEEVADLLTLGRASSESRDSLTAWKPEDVQRGVCAVEEVAHGDLPAGTLVEAVSWDGGWVLDEDTDDGARAWLLEFVEFARAVLGDLAPPRQHPAPPAGPRRFFYPEI